MRAVIAVLAVFAVTPVMAEEITRCVIEVDGTSYLDGPCNYEPFGEGDFNMGDDDYFAYVYPSDSPVIGFWNEEKGAGHAHSPLGELKQDGACWVNEHARICAYR